MAAKEILDFDKKPVVWNPVHINSNKEQVEGIIEALESTQQLIFQGPPGTGKTFLMAELVEHLLSQNKSVLVTAMTNRALIELVEKDSLKELLSKKRVMKTSVSSDELTSCKNLVPIDSKKIACVSGSLTLSTFYNSSGWAKQCYNERPFDYVIMDEASQALFGMIAACKNLGQKVIWIGDQNQMQPIVLLSEETLTRNDFTMLANGFITLCDNFDYKSYMLTETHRLLNKSAALTSLFYHTPIKSVANFDYVFANSNLKYIPKDGGTFILYKNMPVGEKADKSSCDFTIRIVDEILFLQPKLKIAVLTKFRAAVRMLQNSFISQFGSKDNVLIDTVERVQGMTCDVCLYFIPNTMMGMSLNRALFNVATSRAKQLTIIVADGSIMNTSCHKDVHSYLTCVTSGIVSELKDNKPIKSDERIIEGNGVSLHLKGKIDLSKFETSKQKSVKSDTKKNIYIIDTNVFVNCPDIISKIDDKYKVVMSAKVIDELDKLKIKLDATEKKNVETALRLINRAMDKQNVSMELSNPDLLPDDFSKKSPDNNILTVALKFKDENPILLTSDNGLQVKAKGLKISTISLKDFLKR
jgi:rRNA-processing protein FCF1